MMLKDLTGQPAPHFALQADDGSEISLTGLRGKKIVLFFYPEDFTPGCTIENHEFTALSEQFAAQNTVLLGVSPDDATCHARFKTEHDYKTILLADENHDAINAYGVWGPRERNGESFEGLLRTTFLIDAEGKVAQQWSVGEVRGHAQEVLEAATAL